MSEGRFKRINEWTHGEGIWDDGGIDNYLKTIKLSRMEKVKEKSKLGFGDYVEIEQKRFGVDNEMYLYKVIDVSRSNTWVDVPVRAPQKEAIHSEMEMVVRCVCCGICEDEIVTFRIKDVKKVEKIKGERLARYTIGICLVEGGYEIDMLNHRMFLAGKVKIEESECRSYGRDIDVGDATIRVLEFVRGLDKNDYENWEKYEEVKNGISCPKCGTDRPDGPYDYKGLFFPKIRNEDAWSNPNGSHHDWDEYHICKNCEHWYWMSDGSY